MVAIGRALMAKPRLLLLDEPSLGIAPQVIRLIARSLLEINRNDGITVVLVEQNSRMALALSSVCLCAGNRPCRARRRVEGP